MKECRKCNKTFDNSAIYCPICGEKLENQVSQKVNKDQFEDAIIKDIKSQSNEPHPLPPNKMKEYVIKKNLLVFLGLLIAILPFIITGFSFFFTWYILIAFVVFVVYNERSDFNETTEENLSVINTLLIIFLIIISNVYMGTPESKLLKILFYYGTRSRSKKCTGLETVR